MTLGLFPIVPPTKKKAALHILVCARVDTICYGHNYMWDCWVLVSVYIQLYKMPAHSFPKWFDQFLLPASSV